MTTTINPRSIGAEGPFITSDVAELARLKQRLRNAGHSDEVARNIVGWLVDKAAGVKDHTNATTRARYRAILAELGDPPDTRPHGRRPKKGVARNAHNIRVVSYVNQAVRGVRALKSAA